MADPSNAKLRDFQVGLSAQGQAEISPEVTREVYQTTVHLVKKDGTE